MNLFDAPNYSDAKFPEPREFQVKAHDNLRKCFKDGHKNQLIMAATGAGKTYLGMRVIHEALKRGKRAIFVCDRTTLINQTSAVADSYGLAAHSIIQSGHWRFDSNSRFQIASVQTLARRSWPDADVIVIDEAHTQYKAWTDYVQNTDAVVIGLSATPFSKGLGRIFTNLINASTMHELTQSGVLVPMRVFSCTKINMDGAEKTSGGEWKDSAAAQRGMEIIGDVVTEWQKHAENRKTIIFGATIDHCLEMCRQFNEAGIPAATFTSKTTDSERKELLEEFEKPDSFYRVLLSVEALAKGFDVRDVGCVADCRPLRKSLSTAIQMWGRGLRSSPETGKTDCILLDFSGNIIRFADDYSEVYFNGLESLDMGEKLDKAIRRDSEDKDPPQCPACGYSPCGNRCVSCGHERVPKSLVEHLPGEMTEIMVGKAKLADDKKHLYEQVCTYTRANGNPATARQRAWYLFQDLAGCRPSQFWKFEDQPNTVITQNTLNHIKRKQIAFAKAQQKHRKTA